jgi:hypothetical protein
MALGGRLDCLSQGLLDSADYHASQTEFWILQVTVWAAKNQAVTPLAA